MKRIAPLSALFGATLLVACGGGGGYAGISPFPAPPPPAPAAPSPPAPPPPAPAPAPPAPAPAPGFATAEGFWIGTTSTGFTFNVLVLETGEVWGIYGASGQARGAIHGSTTSTGNTFSGAATDYNIRAGAISQITLSGTYTTLQSISGSIVGSNPGTFTGTFDPRYLQPALLSELAGAWSFSAVTSQGYTTFPITITGGGAVSGSVPGCTASGTATPRPSGRNVFDVLLSFSGSICVFNGQSLSGVGVLVTTGSTKQLTVAALLPDQSDGFLATASR